MEQETITLNELFTQTTKTVLEFCKITKSEVADNIRPAIDQDDLGDRLRSVVFKVESNVDSLREDIECNKSDCYFNYVYFKQTLRSILTSLNILYKGGYCETLPLINDGTEIVYRCQDVFMIERVVMAGNKIQYKDKAVVLDDKKQITTALNNKLSATHFKFHNDVEYIKGELSPSSYLYDDLVVLLDAVMKNADASELAENYKVGLLLLEVSDQLLGVVECMIKRNSVPVSDTIESILTECIEVCKSSLDECYRLRGMLETVTE